MLGAVKLTPAHRAFVTSQARIQSFDGSDFVTSTKEDLANVGFFYRRNEQKTRCFYCSVELSTDAVNSAYMKNRCLDRTDYFGDVHIISNHNCEFMMLLKGVTYVNCVKNETFKSIERCKNIGCSLEILRNAVSEFGNFKFNEDQLFTKVMHLQQRRSQRTEEEMKNNQTFTCGELDICSICLENPSDILLIPCGHFACAFCIFSLHKCHICRSIIQMFVKSIL